uniref:Jacalin-type lectin domain-containing protein n=1 Tax=Aegilops tauschii subsp. strangulata TaxID=200361 RepID=A0A453HPR9_AEGTS
WAIVGGTGEFAYAQGVITFNKTWSAQANVRELQTPRQSSVTKIGPWGKISGEFLDVPTTPQRLECVTIRHGVVIDSLAFSFVDQAGGQHNVGPWGGPCGDNKDTVGSCFKHFSFMHAFSSTHNVFHACRFNNLVISFPPCRLNLVHRRL